MDGFVIQDTPPFGLGLSKPVLSLSAAPPLRQAQGERERTRANRSERVAAGYGLAAGLSKDALLTHLVALNARRAAEEKTGRIRWLRPAFQSPAVSQTLQNQELPAPAPQGLQAEMTLENEAKPAASPAPGQNTQPWPASLPAQVRALAQVLADHPGAQTLAGIESRFKGRGPWKKSLPRILETLEALGCARRDGDSWRD